MRGHTEVVLDNTECDVQELLLRVGVLGHVVPLLFGYDATHDSAAQPDPFDYSGTQKAPGPAFLGLGIQRSNMQVSCLLHAVTSCMHNQQVARKEKSMYVHCSEAF